MMVGLLNANMLPKKSRLIFCSKKVLKGKRKKEMKTC